VTGENLEAFTLQRSVNISVAGFNESLSGLVDSNDGKVVRLVFKSSEPTLEKLDDFLEQRFGNAKNKGAA
jgi:hypothetical protein